MFSIYVRERLSIKRFIFFFLLDELFRLVVGKGGLVEVINKKLWREVTKGLNLPSSITSAAFTLRTQYVIVKERKTSIIINSQLSMSMPFVCYYYKEKKKRLMIIDRSIYIYSFVFSIKIYEIFISI